MQSQNKYTARLHAVSRSLAEGAGGRFSLFESGSELVGIIELPNGKTGQFHLHLLTDENEFIDSDAPTGCADDLTVSTADFES